MEHGGTGPLEGRPDMTLKPGLEAQDFDAAERNFQEIAQQLAGDKSLERISAEYEKLLAAVRKSHDNEKRLARKCRELSTELVSNANKVAAALKLGEEDASTIATLKREIEKSWKLQDASQEREAKHREAAAGLRAEIANLTALVEAGTGPGAAEEAERDELLRQKEELLAEREAQVDQIAGARAEAALLGERVAKAEGARAALEAEVGQLREQAAQRRLEAERELRRKERGERELREAKLALEARGSEVAQRQAALAAAEEQVARLTGLLREAHVAGDKATKEHNALTERGQRLQRELTEQIHNNTYLLAENSQKAVELRLKEEALTAQRGETAKVTKVKEAALARLKAVEKQRIDVEARRDELKAEIAGLEREAESARLRMEADRRRAEDLARERDLLTKLRMQAQNASSRQADLLKVNDNTRKNLEAEIAAFRAEAVKAEKAMAQLEREREASQEQTVAAADKLAAAQGEVHLRQVAIGDMQKKIAEGEARLRGQQALYEGVRAERNLYSKNLLGAQDEIADLRRKFKTLNHQIEQLKGEVAQKDAALVKEHFGFMRVEKEQQGLRAEIAQLGAEVKEADATVAAQAKELAQLNEVVAEADKERLRQKKEAEAVLGERDVLGSQLVRRNDELALLYEKTRLQAAALSRGHQAYRDRVAEVRLLRIRLGELTRELHLLRTSVSNIDVLKREVHHLGRRLLQERTKVKALSEELENPLNVHRWRKLEGSDPTSYELIQRVQALQKRLIQVTERVVERDLQIQEQEKLYIELKALLARQPGPEAAQQLSTLQATLREKAKQHQALTSELSMSLAQVEEYKFEIERCKRELSELKRRYVESKRREHEQAGRAAAEKLAASQALPLPLEGQPKFVGGGFAVAARA